MERRPRAPLSSLNGVPRACSCSLCSRYRLCAGRAGASLSCARSASGEGSCHQAKMRTPGTQRLARCSGDRPSTPSSQCLSVRASCAPFCFLHMPRPHGTASRTSITQTRSRTLLTRSTRVPMPSWHRATLSCGPKQSRGKTSFPQRTMLPRVKLSTTPLRTPRRTIPSLSVRGPARSPVTRGFPPLTWETSPMPWGFGWAGCCTWGLTVATSWAALRVCCSTR